MLHGVTQDVRLALRTLRATPFVTSVLIVSLALAAGANTAMFSVVNGLMLRTLPVRDSQELVHVTDSVVQDTGEVRVRAWSNPVWDEFRRRSDLFERKAAWSFVRFNVSQSGTTQPADGMWVDGLFFETLGVPIVLGRPLTPADDQRAGGPAGPAAVLSYGYWQQQFGGAASAVGSALTIDGTAFTIVGVTAPEFFGLEVGRSFDVAVPINTEALVRGADSLLASASTNFLTIVARLRGGETLDHALVRLRAAQPAIRTATMGPQELEIADRFLTSPFNLVPAAHGYSNARRAYGRPAIILLGIVALVLVVGCANVAHLLTGRALVRAHELNMRLALGATRWRLARQLFAEAVLLAVGGAGLGVAVAAVSSRALVAQLATPVNRLSLAVPLDARVLLFTIGVAGLAAIVFGVAPAMLALRADPVDAMRDGGRRATTSHRGSMGLLVTVQMTLTMVLLIGGGLFVQSFTALVQRPIGFNPDSLVVVVMDPQSAGVPVVERRALYARIRDSVAALPGVSHAAISFLTPLGGGGFTPSLEIDAPSGRVRVAADSDVAGNLVSPGWFETLQVQRLVGRDFTAADRAGAAGVAIVNASFAGRYFGGDAVGRTLTVYPGTPRAFIARVVGVVGDVPGSLRDGASPAWFVPVEQLTAFPLNVARLSVRVRPGYDAAAAGDIATAAATVNPAVALTVRRLADQIRAAVAVERVLALLAGGFAVLAVLLAGLGLYGMTAFAVSQQRTDLGVRMVLGAAPSGIVRMVLLRAARVVLAGALAGLVLGAWAGRLVATLLYGFEPGDVSVAAAAATVLAAVSLFAAWLPTKRIARDDLARLLRET